MMFTSSRRSGSLDSLSRHMFIVEVIQFGRRDPESLGSVSGQVTWVKWVTFFFWVVAFLLSVSIAGWLFSCLPKRYRSALIKHSTTSLLNCRCAFVIDQKQLENIKYFGYLDILIRVVQDACVRLYTELQKQKQHSVRRKLFPLANFTSI